jgi:hypothetical protein
LKRELDTHNLESAHLDPASAELDKVYEPEVVEEKMEKYGPQGTIAKFQEGDRWAGAAAATGGGTRRMHWSEAGGARAKEGGEEDARRYRKVDDEVLAAPPDVSDADGSMDVPPVDLL